MVQEVCEDIGAEQGNNGNGQGQGNQVSGMTVFGWVCGCMLGEIIDGVCLG